MTTDEITQLKETLAKLQQAIQLREDELELLRDISSPEEIAQSEAALANLRRKEADMIARLEGTGAIAWAVGIASPAARNDRQGWLLWLRPMSRRGSAATEAVPWVAGEGVVRLRRTVKSVRFASGNQRFKHL